METMVQPKLQSLSNMTSHMIQQQQNRTTQTFNSLIKVRSPTRNKTQMIALYIHEIKVYSGAKLRINKAPFMI